MRSSLFGWLMALPLLLTPFVTFAQATQPPKARVRYDYLLYLPADYTASKAAYPLVIYLHGGSQRGNGGPELERLKTYGLPRQIASGTPFEFIVASPQCPENKFWSTDNWFDSLYTELTTRYRIDPKRVYLTGVSMGGYGTWQTAVAYPDKFAAIMPLCGGCDDSTRICRIKDVPVWTFHGTADDLIPIDETERLVRRLNQCQGNVTFTRLTGEGHDILHLYDDRKLYDWLLKQHR